MKGKKGGTEQHGGTTYVGQRGLAVVDVRNHGHVSDVELEVHDGTHLLGRKVHLMTRGGPNGGKK
jgi:hypothetical protein